MLAHKKQSTHKSCLQGGILKMTHIWKVKFCMYNKANDVIEFKRILKSAIQATQ